MAEKYPIAEGWSRFTINVDHNNIPSDLTQFPIRLDLSLLDNGFWRDVHDGGGDIRITLPDLETEVPRKVLSCDTASRTGLIIFKGDLSSLVDSAFVLHFGKDGVSDYPDSDPFGGYYAWPDGYRIASVDGRNDLTQYQNNGTAYGSPVTGDDPSVFYKSTSYGYSGQYVQIPANANLDGHAKIYVSAIVRTDIYHSGGRWIFAKSAGGTNNGFSLRFNPRIPGYTGWVYVRQRFEDGVGGGNSSYWTAANLVDIVNEKWAHIAVVYDRSNPANEPEIYVNGQLVGFSGYNYSYPFFHDAGLPVNLGADSTAGGTYGIDGWLDDLIFAENAAGHITGAWVEVEYRNVFDMANFFWYTPSPPVPKYTPEEGWHRFYLYVDHTDVISNVTNAFVRIDLSILDSGFWRYVQEGGGDIRITTSDLETELPRKVLSCDIVQKKGAVIARAPLLSSTEDTALVIHIGKEGVVDYPDDNAFGGYSVWPADLGFRIASNDAGKVDLTSYQNPGGGFGTEVSGWFDVARYKSGGTSIGVCTIPPNSAYLGHQKLFVDVTFKIDTAVTSSYTIFSHTNTTPFQWAGSRGFTIGVGPQVNYGIVINQYFKNTFGNTGYSRFRSYPALAKDTWYHLSVMYDRSSPTNAPVVYLNGQLISWDSIQTTTYTIIDEDPTWSWYVGCLYSLGTIDDVVFGANTNGYYSAPLGRTLANNLLHMNSGFFWYTPSPPEPKYKIEDGWCRYKLTIPREFITADLQYFPVRIDLSAFPSKFWNQVSADGHEIRITGSDLESELSRKVLSCDPVTRTGQVIFKATELTAAEDSVFYFHYGKTDAPYYPDTHPYGGYYVWRSEYLIASPDGAATNLTSNGIQGLPHNVTPGDAEGKIGKATYFSGTDTAVEYVQNGTFENLGKFYLSFVLKKNATTNGRIFTKADGGATLGFFVSVSGSEIRVSQTFYYLGAPKTFVHYMGYGGVNEDSWIHIGLIIRRDTGGLAAEPALYVNGVYCDWTHGSTVSNGSTLYDNPNPLYIMARPDGSFYQEETSGWLDEFTLWNNAPLTMTAAFIKAEYHSIFDNDCFVVFSNYEGPNVNYEKYQMEVGWKRVDVTIHKEEIVGEHSCFPVRVDLGGLSNFFWDKVIDGGEIRITKIDLETEVPRGLVSFNKVAKKGALMIAADSLSSAADTTFVLHFGKEGFSDYDPGHPFGMEAVFRDEFKVFSPDGGCTDLTVNHNDASSTYSITPDGVDGKFGLATYFPGSYPVDTGSVVFLDSNASIYNIPQLYIHMVIKEDYQSGYVRLFTRASNGDSLGFYIQFYADYMYISQSTNGNPGLWTYNLGLTNKRTIDVWHSLVVIFDRATLGNPTVLWDGVILTPSSVSSPTGVYYREESFDIAIGARGLPSSRTYEFDGTIDEYELGYNSVGALTASWAQTEYNNIFDMWRFLEFTNYREIVPPIQSIFVNAFSLGIGKSTPAVLMKIGEIVSIESARYDIGELLGLLSVLYDMTFVKGRLISPISGFNGQVNIPHQFGVAGPLAITNSIGFQAIQNIFCAMGVMDKWNVTANIGFFNQLAINASWGTQDALLALLNNLSDGLMGVENIRLEIIEAPIQSLFTAVNSILEKDIIAGMQQILSSLKDVEIPIYNISRAVYLDGRDITKWCLSVAINRNQESVFNEVNITSRQLVLYSLADPEIGYGTNRLEIQVGGDVFYFLLEKRDGNVKDGFTIWGRDPSAKLTEQYREKIEYSPGEAVMALDAAEQIADIVVVDWECMNWLLPEDFDFSGYPIDGVSQLAQEIGGVVRAQADGSLLVRPKYPVRPVNLQKAPADVSYDQQHLITFNKSFNAQKIYDAIKVSNESESDSFTPEMEIEELADGGSSPTIGQAVFVRVFWAGNPNSTNRRFVTNGLVCSQGIYEDTIEDEMVTFVNSKASATRPITSIQKVEWFGQTGTLNFTAGKKDLWIGTEDEQLFRMAKITYRTRYERLSVTHTSVAYVLLVLYLNSNIPAGLLADIVTADSGDSPLYGDGIQSRLLTNEAAAIKRGTAWIDDNHYYYEDVSFEVAYDSRAVDGAIAYLNDDVIAARANYHILSSNISISGPKVVNQITARRWFKFEEVIHG